MKDTGQHWFEDSARRIDAQFRAQGLREHTPAPVVAAPELPVGPRGKFGVQYGDLLRITGMPHRR